MKRKIKRYGWKPDLPDHRDLRFSLKRVGALPELVDLQSLCPPVYDQGNLGSCTANAIAGTFQFLRLKEGLSDFVPSRLMIYYDEREIEGTVSYDSGAQIRDGIQSMTNKGACDELLWPYDESQFTVKPTQAAYDAALKDVALQYERIDSTQLDDMRGCLAEGFPFVFGFTVYQRFESPEVEKTGIVQMPSPNESVIGGHAVMAIGYDNQTARFICRNSWGSSWGQSGYFTMPYDYLTDVNLADDFWKISLVGPQQ